MSQLELDSLYSLFFISLAFASLVGLTILVRSIQNFSRTGPQITDEVLAHYRLYSLYALSRLYIWLVIISFFLCLPGSVFYISLCIIFDIPFNGLISLLCSSASLILLTCFQFSKKLLLNPTSIALSSSYSLQKTIRLWKLLSTKVLNIIALPVLLSFLIIVCSSLYTLISYKQYDFLLYYALLVFLLLFPNLFLSFNKLILKKPKNASNQLDKMNLIMIGVDTLRADCIGKKRDGNSITPNIDALKEKSINFENCYVPIARTAPSLVSLMTGLSPWSHGIKDNFVNAEQLTLDSTPFPMQLKNRGYNTAVISDWCGSDFGKFDFGFDEQDLPDDQWNIKYFIRQGPKDIRLFLSLFLDNKIGQLCIPEIFYLGGVPKGQYLEEKTIQSINKLQKKSRPFFLNVFFSTTHPPFGSDYPYYAKYSNPDYDGESKYCMSKLTDPMEIIKSQREPKEAFDLEQILDLYDGAVSNFDHQVGVIVDYLNETGLDKNTIIVIYSDHGMEFFENDTWGQGNNILSDYSFKVPCIISTPKSFKKETINETIRNYDVFPTILDLLSIKSSEKIDGHSLRDAINNKKDFNLDTIGETGIWFTKPPNMEDGHLSYPDLLELIEIPDKKIGTITLKQEYEKIINDAKDRMIISGKWKLVERPFHDGKIYSLFNLEHDPANKQDISSDFPEVVTELKTRLGQVVRG